MSSLIIGARNEKQLRQNLGAIGWARDAGQIARLDAASAVTPSYPRFPYYRQRDLPGLIRRRCEEIDRQCLNCPSP